MAGFDNGRIATGVHDPIEARALVLRHGETTVVFVVCDVIGLLMNRPAEIAARVEEETGISAANVIVAATHNHEGPDTIGMWGAAFFKSGLIPGYLDMVADKAVEAVVEATAGLKPARLRFAAKSVNPEGIVKDGTLHGIGRDPQIVDPLLAVMAVDGLDGAPIATLSNFAAHAESLWDENTLITSDWPGFFRQAMEKGADLDNDGTVDVPGAGGTALLFNGALGGMQTAGVSEPTFEESSRMANALAAEGLAEIEGAGEAKLDGIQVNSGYAMIPLHNHYLMELAKQLKLMEVDPEDFSYTVDDCGEQYGCTEEDVALCQEEIDGEQVGCAAIRMQVVTMGPAQFVTVPGELLPELASGLPDDFAEIEAQGRPNEYFPQHDPADPMSQHVSPYEVPEFVRGLMTAEFPFVLGLANHEGGYILLESDFIPIDPLKDEEEGDHYEETVSMGAKTFPVFLSKLKQLLP
jgi:hypothetical protein